MIKRLKLKGLNNTRDLGGLSTKDGRKIKSGKLIRSGKLYKLPNKTVSALKDMGLTTVVDLRTETERNEKPDTKMEGVAYFNHPLFCTPTGGITTERSMFRVFAKESKRIKDEFGSGENYMKAVYQSVVYDAEPKRELAAFLHRAVNEEGCLLFHCSGGKDRAGIAAMLLESLLGVKEELIMEDYIASRKFLRSKFFWNKFGLVISPFYLRIKRVLWGTMKLKPEFMKSVIDGLEEKYGSVVEYCKQELSVTDEDIETLKAKYLE